MYKIWLDDIRSPPTDGWEIARSVAEAREIVLRKGINKLMFISFDHDLGEIGNTGFYSTAMEFVHWLINFDMECPSKGLPEEFDFLVHSQNPVGAMNIEKLLRGYLQQR